MSRPIGPQVKVSMHTTIVDKIDELAADAGRTRSEWVRDAVARALGASDYDTLTGSATATAPATAETGSD